MLQVFELMARTLKRQHEGGEPLIQGGDGNIKLGTGGSSQVNLFLATLNLGPGVRHR